MIMIKNRKLLKVIALFLASNILLNIVLPLLFLGMPDAKAATNQVNSSGVTPPNLVDLKTGDMNYSVPFIDLPGAYSFPLYYRAGIRPMENSSWIGLGWSMEAGEITRTVNGYPDDYAGPQYEKYFAGNPLPASATKQYKPYGCLQGYKMTTGLNVGDALPDDVLFDTYVSHFPDTLENYTCVVYPS